MDEEEAAAAAEAEAAEAAAAAEAAKGPSSLVLVEEHKTVWQKRAEAAKEKLRSTYLYRRVHRLPHELEQSQNPLISKIVDAKYAAQDRMEDFSEKLETSQHPLLYRLREAQESLTSESEMGFALSQIREQDPAFDQMELLRDLEEYMIPVIVRAFLQGRLDVLHSACEETAADAMTAVMKERAARGVTLDDTILDIQHVDLNEAIVMDGKPLLKVSFVVQQIHCIKDKKTGKVIEGGESEIANVYYTWLLRRDFDNPDFDWAIQLFHFHQVLALV